MISDYIEHAEVFEFMKAAASTWKYKQWTTIVAINLKLHVVPDIGAVPSVIFAVH
jgi:hypothetical protein